MHPALKSIARSIAHALSGNAGQPVRADSRWEPVPLPRGYPFEAGIIVELEDDGGNDLAYALAEQSCA